MGFWHSQISLLQKLHLPSTPLEIINDAGMVLFFFLAGLEIKRELKIGALASLKRAALPVFAACGGVIFPAMIYSICNRNSAFANGWGIPTATDIAFSLGIAALLGRKYFPDSLRIFLTALAIIDDLIAIVIVALFYGEEMSAFWLIFSLVLSICLFIVGSKSKKTYWWQYLLAIVLWYAVFRSGVHATMAGVLFAFSLPVSQTEKLEKTLHFPINFIIVPLFALANTCIAFPKEMASMFSHAVFWGVAAGLFIGKPLGICTFVYILVKLKWGKLPRGTNFYQIIGMGLLAGIGFTMSIFIATLAFNAAAEQDIAKISVLAGSLLSMLAGFLWLRFGKRKTISPLPNNTHRS